MTRRNETAYWIKRKRREKFEDTPGELALDRFSEHYAILCRKSKVISFVEPDRSGKPRRWNVTPDRVLVLGTGRTFEAFVDGVLHFTDRRRSDDDWTSEQLAKRGHRNVRIDDELLTDERHWPYVLGKLEAFAGSTDGWTRLWA